MNFNPTGIDWNAGGKSGLVKFGDDSSALVVIYNKAVEIPFKSVELGRRYCENQIYIQIQHPGETGQIIDRPLKEEDKHRYRSQWSAFVQNRSQIPEGTPIDLLFPNHPAAGENLRALGIYTIEQCAELSASAIDNIGRGGQEYVNRSKKYLESASKGSNYHKVQRELDDANLTIKRLEEMIANLQAQVNSVNDRLTNPMAGSLSPPFIPGHDAQAARINSNHVTAELASKAPKKLKSKPAEKSDPLTDELAGILNNKHSGAEVADDV